MSRVLQGVVLISLLLVGSPEAQAGPKPAGIAVAPDLDGDGGADLIALWRDVSAAGVPSVRVEALRGSNGSTIWSVTEPGEPEYGFPGNSVLHVGPLGPGGEPGVLFGATEALPHPTLELTEDHRTIALGSDGRELWRSDVTHVEHALTGEVREVWSGGQLLPGAAPDTVLHVRDHHTGDGPIDPEQEDAFRILDGTDGSLGPPLTGAVAWLSVGPDLSGDGLQDLIWRRNEGGATTFEAREAFGTEPLWRLSGIFGAMSWGLGDVDGDGVEDGLINGFMDRTVVSGGSGTVLWGTPDQVAPLGDATGDGSDDLLLWRTGKEGEASTVRYRGVTGEGTELFERSYTVPPSQPGAATSASVVPLGDADGDGVGDAWQLLRDGGAVPAPGSGLVSGRTGELVWEAAARGIGFSMTWTGPLDGGGVDLLEMPASCGPRARSGADGSLLWQAPAEACGGLGGLADLDGDGRTDVVLTDAGRGVTAVSGADGAVLWSR